MSHSTQLGTTVTLQDFKQFSHLKSCLSADPWGWQCESWFGGRSPSKLWEHPKGIRWERVRGSQEPQRQILVQSFCRTSWCRRDLERFNMGHPIKESSSNKPEKDLSDVITVLCFLHALESSPCSQFFKSVSNYKPACFLLRLLLQACKGNWIVLIST